LAPSPGRDSLHILPLSFTPTTSLSLSHSNNISLPRFGVSLPLSRLIAFVHSSSKLELFSSPRNDPSQSWLLQLAVALWAPSRSLPLSPRYYSPPSRFPNHLTSSSLSPLILDSPEFFSTRPFPTFVSFHRNTIRVISLTERTSAGLLQSWLLQEVIASNTSRFSITERTSAGLPQTWLLHEVIASNISRCFPHGTDQLRPTPILAPTRGHLIDIQMVCGTSNCAYN
jgi:hypothetical protein